MRSYRVLGCFFDIWAAQVSRFFISNGKSANRITSQANEKAASTPCGKKRLFMS
jgi:hypothetical protein